MLNRAEKAVEKAFGHVAPRQGMGQMGPKNKGSIAGTFSLRHEEDDRSHHGNWGLRGFLVHFKAVDQRREVVFQL